jgi:hypothetical protein
VSLILIEIPTDSLLVIHERFRNASHLSFLDLLVSSLHQGERKFTLMLRQQSKINYKAHYLLTSFPDATLEDRFQYFRNPSTFVFPAIGILGLLHIGYMGIIAVRAKNYSSAAPRLTASILSALLVIIDLCFIVMHRRRLLTDAQFVKRQRYLRIIMVAVMLAIDMVITFEFWDCASRKSATCLMEFRSKNLIATVVPIWLSINFFENLLKTLLCIAVEIAVAQRFNGQPLVMRATRPLYASCVALIFLAIQRWLEHEARQHFLAVVHREALQQEVTQKRRQIAATLESITEPEQLDSLLAGQDTVHQREQLCHHGGPVRIVRGMAAAARGAFHRSADM